MSRHVSLSLSFSPPIAAVHSSANVIQPHLLSKKQQLVWSEYFCKYIFGTVKPLSAPCGQIKVAFIERWLLQGGRVKYGICFLGGTGFSYLKNADCSIKKHNTIKVHQ